MNYKLHYKELQEENIFYVLCHQLHFCSYILHLNLMSNKLGHTVYVCVCDCLQMWVRIELPATPPRPPRSLVCVASCSLVISFLLSVFLLCCWFLWLTLFPVFLIVLLLLTSALLHLTPTVTMAAFMGNWLVHLHGRSSKRNINPMVTITPFWIFNTTYRLITSYILNIVLFYRLLFDAAH